MRGSAVDYQSGYPGWCRLMSSRSCVLIPLRSPPALKACKCALISRGKLGVEAIVPWVRGTGCARQFETPYFHSIDGVSLWSVDAAPPVKLTSGRTASGGNGRVHCGDRSGLIGARTSKLTEPSGAITTKWACRKTSRTYHSGRGQAGSRLPHRRPRPGRCVSVVGFIGGDIRAGIVILVLRLMNSTSPLPPPRV